MKIKSRNNYYNKFHKYQLIHLIPVLSIKFSPPCQAVSIPTAAILNSNNNSNNKFKEKKEFLRKNILKYPNNLILKIISANKIIKKYLKKKFIKKEFKILILNPKISDIYRTEILKLTLELEYSNS